MLLPVLLPMLLLPVLPVFIDSAAACAAAYVTVLRCCRCCCLLLPMLQLPMLLTMRLTMRLLPVLPVFIDSTAAYVTVLCCCLLLQLPVPLSMRLPMLLPVTFWLFTALGKIFHPGHPADFDPPSWSDPQSIMDNAGHLPTLPTTSSRLSAVESAGLPACLSGEHGGSYCELNSTIGPDDGLTTNAVQSLHMLANYSQHTAQPFFLSVGFHK